MSSPMLVLLSSARTFFRSREPSSLLTRAVPIDQVMLTQPQSHSILKLWQYQSKSTLKLNSPDQVTFIDHSYIRPIHGSNERTSGNACSITKPTNHKAHLHPLLRGDPLVADLMVWHTSVPDPDSRSQNFHRQKRIKVPRRISRVIGPWFRVPYKQKTATATFPVVAFIDEQYWQLYGGFAPRWSESSIINAAFPDETLDYGDGAIAANARRVSRRIFTVRFRG